ncbi:MAG: hypothetical protein JWO82_4287, partial [Akkermansiaceae bacterium]|nr:hypothetical protein [Akkermansiaceae bacterium]
MKVSPHPLRRRSAAARAAAALLVLLCEIGVLNEAVMAGDILRGGATSGAPVGASNPTGTAPPAIAPAGGTTRDSLARTAQAIQAMQAMQLAARNVANQGANHAIKNPSGKGGTLPDVPNGIGKGGLQVDPRVTGGPTDPLWTGADLPSQTTTSGGTQVVTVKQTAQQAVLNWETFNVGKNTTLKFDQSAGGANVGQWIAFNKVNDPMANPSQILGSIEAPGQVYVINRNGIIFGGGSQVNVHALVASTLSINDDLVKQGLLNNPTNKFLFSGLGGPADSKVGDVIVEAGAKLTAPTTVDKVGGRIALIGANVSNEGTISTTDGQTILAAGLEVGFTAHATTDPSLRGLDTYIGAVVDPASTLAAYAGTATNSGLIDAGRANVTIAGKNVQQLGIITSTTSVSFNGRIDLLANYDAVGNPFYNPATVGSPTFLNRSVGTVTLGEGSVTQILPELDSTEKAIGSKLALPSQINLQGQEIHFDNNSILYAPSANVVVNAGAWQAILPTNQTSIGTYQFVHTGGRIDLDSGALIDVSGSKNVTSSVASNIIAVELRGSELADSPLLRDGALRGQTIYVDITKTGTYNGKAWVGTPLADVSGYVNLVQRTVGELTAAGGTVKLNAGDAVVIREGAKVDVSGGTINYVGGVVQTSRVVSNGKIFDVADATPDRVYDGVYRGGSITKSKAWGVTEQFVNPLTLNGSHYQEGFLQGGNGGTLDIASGAVAIDGTLKGTTFTGVRQRTIGPVASTLNISFTADRFLNGTLSAYSPNATSVVFSNNAATDQLADFSLDDAGKPLALPADRLNKLILDPDLVGANGFGNLSVKTPEGDVVVEKGIKLETTPRGSISLSGANVDVEGSLIAAGGTISVTTYDISPNKAAELVLSGGPLPAVDPTRGLFTLGEGATLSTAGYLVDDRPESATLLKTPLVTNGGTISVTSLSANLSEGSLIDVSGGVVATAGGKYTYGNAGGISLLTGRDTSFKGVVGGELHLGGELRGMSGATGGSLTVQAAAVQVGGDSAPQGVLHLDSNFFNQGGFSSFTVNGIGRADGPGLLIVGGTRISPVISSWLASSVDGAISLDTYVKDAGLRSTASLSFGALGSTDDQGNFKLLLRGDLKVEEGAVIDAGATGAIKLNGQTVEVQGSLLAAGGSIQVNGAGKLPLPNNANGTEADTTVWIGPHAVLNAAG